MYHNALANAYNKAGQTDKAIAEYTKVAQMDPPAQPPRISTRARSSPIPARLTTRIAAFDKVISLDPTRAEAYYWKGVNMMGKATTGKDGKFTAPPGTAECFQKYLELKPEGPMAQPSKDMLASIGSSVETTFGKQKAAAAKKKQN